MSVVSTSHGLIIELSKDENSQKYRILLSQYTNYEANGWSK